MLTFATKEAAQNHLDEHLTPSSFYILAHGEYSTPEYTPRRYKDGWGVHCTYSYYAGSFYAPRDGRIEFGFAPE